jgi:hypothetical protein
LEISINPKKVVLIFAIAAGLLFIAHTVSLVLTLSGEDYFYGVVPLFDLDQEKNAPTYFSSLSLAFAAALVAVIAAAHRGKRYFWHWVVMSVAFLFVSFDELVAVHEQLSQPLRATFEFTGFLFYPWVTVYGAIVLVLAFKYWGFLWDLPSRTRMLFFVSAGLFLSGAVGLEMVGAHFTALHGTSNTIEYKIAATIEETLEISAAILFLYAILRYMQDHLAGVRVKMAAPAVQPVYQPAHAQVDREHRSKKQLKKN